MNGRVFAALLSTPLLQLMKEELEQVIAKNREIAFKEQRVEAEQNLRVVKDVLYSREQDPCDEHCTHAF